MINNYIKRSAMLLGAVALVGSTALAEEGTWRNVNHKLQNPAYIPAWSGALTDVQHGVGEVWNSAFDLYQVLPDMPAGEYTLTVNAFYRYTNNGLAEANLAENDNAYIYINGTKQTVVALYSLPDWPNGLEAANICFSDGKYLNTVTATHPGGDLVIGIGNTGGYWDEWCAFDNFKLNGPDGEVTVPNGDFSEGLNVDKNQTIWNCLQIGNDVKAPDANRSGGVYRKTNASPYNIGQAVELEAGKYRFSVQSFMRYGAGNTAGEYLDLKDDQATTKVGESAWDRHVNGTEDEAHNAYIYVTDGWSLGDDEISHDKPLTKDEALDPDYGNPDGFYLETAIMCLFDVDLDKYPDNQVDNALRTNETDDWYTRDGFERQAAAVFVNNPDLYRNYVEFTLDKKSTVWLGIKKDVNAPVYYWNPWRDIKLEMFDPTQSAVENVFTDAVDENAPVEYYNLQGVKVNVENAAPGLYIVKQGKKVTKQIIRK